MIAFAETAGVQKSQNNIQNINFLTKKLWFFNMTEKSSKFKTNEVDQPLW